MADAALDLSAPKISISTNENGNGKIRCSPIPSTKSESGMSSISGSSPREEQEFERPRSAVKPVAGPIPTRPTGPTGHHMVKEEGEESAPEEESEAPSEKSPGVSQGRPFKMYPMDPLSMYPPQLLSGSVNPLSPGFQGALGMSSMYDSVSAFPSFPMTPLTSHLLQRKRRSETRTETNSNTSSTPGSSADADSSAPTPKKSLIHVPEEKKDESYWERRRKNNDAAKRSRDSRRHKEEEIAMRAAFLEQENLKLRAQVAILKNETAKLHYMLYNRM